MKKIMIMVLAALTVAACQQNQSNLERKVDALATQLASIDKKIASMGAPAKGGAQQPQRPRRPEPDPAAVFAVPIVNLPAVGPADAPITIVEGYEYACPACNAARTSVAQVREQYGDKVRVVYKPYIVHPDVATDASIAVCAAFNQGKFAAMDQLVWDKAFGGRDFTAPKLEALAKEAGVDMARYKKDVAGPCRDFVAQHHGELKSFGQGATPTFYINGRYIVGGSPVALKAVIDQELKLATERIAAGTKPADYYETWVLGKGLKKFEPKPGA